MPEKPTYEELEQRIKELEKAESEALAISRNITDRKRTEEALRESEARYRSLFQNNQFVMLIIDPENADIVDANPAAISYYGWSLDELTAKKITDINMFTEEQVFQELEKAKSEQRRYFVFQHRLSNGDIRDVEVYSGPINLHGDKFLFSIIHDITERKRAEKAEFEAMARFYGFAEASQYGMGMADLDGHIVYANSALARMLGEKAPGVCLGKHFPTVYYSSLMARKLIEEVMPALMRNGQWHGELELLTADRRRVPTDENYFVIRDQNGKPRYLAVILTDITDRKQAERALRESEEKYRILIEESTDPIFSFTPDGRYTFVNSAFANGVGKPARDIIGKTIWDVFPREEAEKRFAALNQVFETGTEKVIEVRVPRPDGDQYYMTTITPVKDPEDHVDSIICSSKNITARKSMEEEHERLRNQLTQAHKMEAVGRLAGGVAHDFNNMLSVIIGHAGMALKEMDPTLPLYPKLQEIRKAGERSADLTRQLLAFARKQTISPKVIDINQTVEGTTRMLQRLIGEDIDLAWRPGGNVWPLKMDPSQIDQILANLCVNARDAITDVGKVTIETGNAEFDESYCIDHPGFIPGEYVLLAVSDNGCGMDAETLENIFEPFFTTKESGKGTGLGLATVYGVVKQNDGFVNVYSEPGQGTTFKIYLPRYLPESDVLPETAKDHSTECGHETILLVEDEAAILDMTTLMLEKLGYQVVPARTPGEAIRFSREYAGEIHLLLTDVVMPEMNGRDLAKNILSIHPNIGRLFMSGYTANVIAHHGVLDEGVNFIQKPFSMEKLGVRVREVLDRNK